MNGYACNNTNEFRVHKHVLCNGSQLTDWVDLRKGVAHLFRCPEVSLQADAGTWMPWL